MHSQKVLNLSCRVFTFLVRGSFILFCLKKSLLITEENMYFDFMGRCCQSISLLTMKVMFLTSFPGQAPEATASCWSKLNMEQAFGNQI